MAFLTQMDIWNRACQHCGVPQIKTLTENSRQRTEISTAYDGLRQAEMRRNNWRFAIRRARLRPLDDDTILFTPNAWSSATAYTIGQMVSFANYYWILSVPTSTGDQPDTSTKWQHYFGPLTLDEFNSGDAGYGVSELVQGSDNNIYLSLQNINTTNPVGAASGFWATLAGTTQALTILWPAGSGPISSTLTNNVYRLPNGYLREAPQDPKAGIQSYLGINPGGLRLDWTFEGNYIISSSASPMMFRFAADVWDVTAMEAMFCEGLAARVAEAVCEILTQSTTKLAAIKQTYERVMGEARTVGLIEQGPTFPPMDDYISCRF